MPIEKYEFEEGDDRLTNGHGMINWHAVGRRAEKRRADLDNLASKLDLPVGATLDEIRKEFSRRAHLPNRR